MIGLLMMLAMRLDGAHDTTAARDIRTFCEESLSGQPPTPTALAACIGAQQQALKHYLGIWVMFDAPKAEAERCMRAGRAGAHVDWVKAEACMRAWSKGRENVIAKGMKK